MQTTEKQIKEIEEALKLKGELYPEEIIGMKELLCLASTLAEVLEVPVEKQEEHKEYSDKIMKLLDDEILPAQIMILCTHLISTIMQSLHVLKVVDDSKATAAEFANKLNLGIMSRMKSVHKSLPEILYMMEEEGSKTIVIDHNNEIQGKKGAAVVDLDKVKFDTEN